MLKEELTPTARKKISKLGGLGRAKALSPEKRSQIAQKAALARWSGKTTPAPS